MISHYPKPEVGMEVFYVPSSHRRGNPYSVTIAKVGKKWVTLAGHFGRFDIATWELDGGNYSSPGTCYPSEEEYNAQQLLSTTWREFKEKVKYRHVPDSVTVEKIWQAADILGVELLKDVKSLD
jgi:hypothetical protein